LADRLDRPGKNTPRVGVEAEAYALPRPQMLQAVLAIIGDDPPAVGLDAGEHRRAGANVRTLSKLDVGDVPVRRRTDGRPTQVEDRIRKLRFDARDEGMFASDLGCQTLLDLACHGTAPRSIGPGHPVFLNRVQVPPLRGGLLP